ncbi:MAG: hypothetical protein JSW33_08010 [bacterium]|nr:MAG: hypothetical protein JSW33_08010 [bacterium]
MKILPKDILQVLEKICTSSEFVSKGRSCQLLRYLIHETLQDRGDQLKQYNIGRAVFGRNDDFNPDLDPMVRIQAGRLRRSLEIYYLTEGKDDPIRISLFKGSYVPVFLSYEDKEIQSVSEIVPLNQDELSSFTGPSIGVIPFKNLTGDSEREFFVQGFSEELIQELTHYEDFRIIAFRGSPDSGYNYSLSNTSDYSPEADFLIEGTVRELGQQLKISVTLTHTKTREHLWGEQYQREMTATNLIIVQEEIARQVIATIAGEYGIIPQRLSRESRQKRTTDLSVYESKLRYYYYQSQQTPEAAQIAFDALQNAIQKDPECGLAIAMLASLYGNAYMLDRPGSEAALDKSTELAYKAIELEPTNQLVRLILAWTHFMLNNREQFFNEIENTLALNPNSPVRIGAVGFFIALYGDWERGKMLLDRAMGNNIGYPRWYHGATSLYCYRKNNYEAAYQEALKYDIPGLFWGPMLRIGTLGQLERREEVQVNIDQLITLKPDFSEKARDLISRYVKEEELVDHILEGLQKAGLNFNDQ